MFSPEKLLPIPTRMSINETKAEIETHAVPSETRVSSLSIYLRIIFCFICHLDLLYMFHLLFKITYHSAKIYLIDVLKMSRQIRHLSKKFFRYPKDFLIANQ